MTWPSLWKLYRTFWTKSCSNFVMPMSNPRQWERPHRYVRLTMPARTAQHPPIRFEVEWLPGWTVRKIHGHPEWTEDMVRRANEIADGFERRNGMKPE